MLAPDSPVPNEILRSRTTNLNPSAESITTSSAVAWGAVLAGAAAAASLSLILLVLGVGLGLSSVSPWAREGASASALGWGTVAWLTATQLAASALGGYLAGRLRTRWLSVHSDEVYFRDTAHGFLAWAVATLATAALLTSAISSIVNGGVQAGATVAGGAAATATATAASGLPAADAGPMAYFVDSLFRREPAAAGATVTAEATPRSAAQDTAEVTRIIMNAGRNNALPPEDLRYVAMIVAQRTGMAQPEAERRVAGVLANAQSRLNETELAARAAADKARKASAYSALWLFVSLLSGAFFASWAATFGGRRRDA